MGREKPDHIPGCFYIFMVENTSSEHRVTYEWWMWIVRTDNGYRFCAEFGAINKEYNKNNINLDVLIPIQGKFWGTHEEAEKELVSRLFDISCDAVKQM